MPSLHVPSAHFSEIASPILLHATKDASGAGPGDLGLETPPNRGCAKTILTARPSTHGRRDTALAEMRGDDCRADPDNAATYGGVDAIILGSLRQLVLVPATGADALPDQARVKW